MKILHSKSFHPWKDKVFLAVPSYGGICAEFVYSLFGSKEELAKANIAADLCIFDGNCHVDDSRNRLVREFLDSDCDQLVFLDTDLQWDALDLVRLIQHDRPIVGGIYPLKQKQEEFPVRWLKGGEIWSDKDGLIEVESVPTGFLKIKREVFETLEKQVPKFQTRVDHKMLPLIFERTMVGKARFGGDYEFCRKARAQGFGVYIDPEMRFIHMGAGEWGGSFGSYLRRKAGMTDEYIAGLVREMVDAPPTPEQIAKLAYEWNNDWQAPVELLGALAMLSEETEGPILECGSGVSTLILGAIAKRRGIKLLSLEHDRDWSRRVRKILVDSDIFQYRPLPYYAPIVEGWYLYPHDDEKFKLVLVDGPPRKYGRSGLLKIKDSFAPGCIFIVDDAEEAVTDELRKIGVNFMADYGRFVIGKLEAEVPCQLQTT
jgi:hypothetical protein